MTPRLDQVPALLEPIRGFVFDKDGTLADLNARWVPVFHHLIAELVEDPGERQVLGEILGVGVDHLVVEGAAAVMSEVEIQEVCVEYLGGFGYAPTAAKQHFARACEGLPYGPVVPLGPVAGALAELAAANYRLGIATSDSRPNTELELVELGIAHLVNPVRCGDEDVIKPSPEVLFGVASAWAVRLEEVAFVGDSVQDGDTARSAGCPFIAVVPEGVDPAIAAVAVGADAWVHSVAELAGVGTR